MEVGIIVTADAADAVFLQVLGPPNFQAVRVMLLGLEVVGFNRVVRP